MQYSVVMRKDSLREYIQTSAEAYDLAATPDPLSIFKDTVDDVEPLDCPVMHATSRKAQLDLGIDVKRIFDGFIKELITKHGPDRADRFITWIRVGNIYQFHTDNRRQIKWDRKRLQSLIYEYRHHVW